MTILVDADACPVRQIVEKVASEFEIPVIMVMDSAHVLESDYSEIITVAQGRDAVDIALINRAEKGDVVVTQDYGVAAMALGKGAFAINNSGLVFTDNNIDRLLFERHVSAKLRRSGVRTCGFHKRTAKDDEEFEKSFRRLILSIINRDV